MGVVMRIHWDEVTSIPGMEWDQNRAESNLIEETPSKTLSTSRTLALPGSFFGD
jgi:hypothetical protein